jgi:uncharacterized protein (DUF4415 family)
LNGTKVEGPMKRKKEHTVNFDLDPKRPTPLSDEERAELKALADMPDDQIDYDDIPPLDDKLLGKLVRGGIYRPRKKQMTLRVDMDVLAWQKTKGKGYQSRINRILRQAMIKDLKSHG